MTSIHLQTGRQVGFSTKNMRKYHGDGFIMYELASSRTKGKLLDIACGTGTGTNFLSDHAEEVIGVDIDRTTIDHCKKYHKKKNLRFLAADATKKLPFKNKTFDCITTFETIEHLYPDERQKYLAQLRRVLKDDGIIMLSTPQNGINKPNHIIRFVKHKYDHKIEFCLKQLKKELRDAGFEIIEQGGIMNKLRAPEKTVKRSNSKKSNKLKIIAALQPITKIVPISLKEKIGHWIFGYPFRVENFYFTKNNLDKTMSFYLILKKHKIN